MKIIAYAHPPVTAEGASYNIGWAYVLLDILRPLCVHSADVQAALVVGARFAKTIANPPLPPNLRLIVVDEIALHQELSAEGYRLGKVSSIIMQERWDDPAATVLTRHVADAVKQANWHMTPDVILSFAVKAGFLNRLWPSAPVFHIEMGPFSRAPFPRSIFMDHAGIYDSAITARNATQGGIWPVTEAGALMARDLRDDYAAQIAAINPFRHHDYRRRFEKLCLLPLQVSGNFTFDDQAPYHTQLEYVADILAATPKDVGLVVTEYNHWTSYLDTQAPSRSLEFFKRHPSFIYPLKSRGMTSPSLFLAPMVDGVWTVSSNVGYLGLFFGKRLGAASRQLGPLASHNDPASLMAQLGQPAPAQDALIGWMLERYYIPAALYADPRWMLDYLKRRVAVCHKPDLAVAYPPLADTDRLKAAWRPQPPAPDFERAFFAADLWARKALAEEQRKSRPAPPAAMSRKARFRRHWDSTQQASAETPQTEDFGYAVLNVADSPRNEAFAPTESAGGFIHALGRKLNLCCFGAALDQDDIDRLEQAPRYADLRLIIFNGDGPANDDPDRLLALMKFCARSRSTGKRTVLINGDGQKYDDALGEQLRHFDIVAARDSSSLCTLKRWRPDARLVPDIAFAALYDETQPLRDRRAAAPEKHGISCVALDAEAVADTDSLLDFARFHDMPCYVAEERLEARYASPEWLYQLDGQYFPRASGCAGDLAPYDSGVTGRLDGLITLLLCRIAPLAWPDRNRRIEGLLEDMGLTDRVLLPPHWISAGHYERREIMDNALALWDDVVWQKVDAYVAQAHERIKSLTADIAALLAHSTDATGQRPQSVDTQLLYGHIERQRQQVKRLNDQIAKIYASRSWRITRSLRVTRRMAGRATIVLNRILSKLNAKMRPR